MAATTESKDRHVVPRWRTFQETLASNELDGTSTTGGRKLDGTDFLLEKEQDWQINRALPFALDLVSAATIFGKTKSSTEAAEFILQNGGRTSEVGKQLAQALLGIEMREPEKLPPQSRIQITSELKVMKAKRIQQPRNAFVWVDLARLYTLLGQNMQARQTLTTALALAPSDRFVLRSAVRFLHHINEHEEALDLLRKNGRTPEDPWLMAAEIAAAGMAEKSPKFSKRGSELLANGGSSHFHTSELASALGTLEMSAGKDRKANKLFWESLVTPTGNSLAQAVWASKRTGLEEINPEFIVGKHAVEALTLDYLNKGNWEMVMAGTERWIAEEGFSARPAELASCIATSLLDKPELGATAAEKGLKTNPKHPILTNNKAFGQILQGKAAQGMATLAETDLARLNKRERICLLATTGLGHFRLGNADDGRKFYRAAIMLAKEPEDIGLRTLASLYLAREEALRGQKQGCIDFKRAFVVAERLKQTIIPAIADHLAPEVEGEAARHQLDLQIRIQPKTDFIQMKDGDLFARFGQRAAIPSKAGNRRE